MSSFDHHSLHCPSDEFRVVFMGTPAFAATALQKILDAGYSVVGVFTQPPRPKGRGQQLQKSDVHELADRYQIPVFTPISFRKDPAALDQFKALNPTISVVAAYGLLLPQSALDIPKYGCLNIHGSLLPRWRGASPIQHAVWYGDDQTGVTIMQMTKGLDEGPMILKSSIPITSTTTSETLYRDLADIGGDAVCDVLARYRAGDIPHAEPQHNDDVTIARLLTKEDGVIDWSKPARIIDCAVRALNPWPATVTVIHEKRLKILNGMVVDTAHNGSRFGEILNADGDIACGDGSIYRITELQPDNSKRMKFHDALNGGHFKIGDVLGL